MPDYYDKDGSPLAMLEWAKKFEDKVYSRVAETTLPNGTWISTVWMGRNHSYDGGPPLIFETMVFPSKDDIGDMDMDRYSTLEDAMAGHIQMVKRWQANRTVRNA